MTDFITLSKIEGLQFMPVREDKRPIHDNWQNNKTDYNFTNARAIGLVCGTISGNVEAIDLDLKYDLTGALFSEYKKLVNSIDKTVLKKLLVQKTVSNGYHFIYRCEKIEGNKKLAERYTTHEEKQKTYEKTYKHALEEALKDPEKTEQQRIDYAKNIAEKAAKNDKVRVLIETRGDKGYIACSPTKGYSVVYGSFDGIQTITEQQRGALISAAQAFNDVIKEYTPPKAQQEIKISKGMSPFEHYNNDGDVVSLLQEYGWRQVGRKGRKVLLVRPGETKAVSSGNYDEDKRWFSVFSTSTEFDPQHAYQPYAVFAMLKCNGDFKEASRQLYEMGFGDRFETIIENKIEIPSSVNLADDDYSFLATPQDYDNYLDKWRKGTFEMGKSTGIPELDKYFLFKEGNLVIINGIDNVGKSTVLWYLSMQATMLHGWSVLLFSSENHVGTIIRKLIEFYWCEPIATMTELKYKQGKKYVEDHFDFIKVGRELYNYKDWINMITKALKKKKYHIAMGDPYNTFKVDIPVKSKQGTYDYHYEAASVLQLFGKNNNISLWLNCHVGTIGARNKDKDGFTLAPQKEDTEMGVMFANKADDFLTVHRVTQHETEWMMTEIHVRKIKETETGGKVTPKNKPVKIKMVNGLSGFQHFDYNPVLEWHKKQGKESSPQLTFHEPINQKEDFTNEEDEELNF